MNTLSVVSVIFAIILFAAAFLPLVLAGTNVIVKKKSKKIALVVNIISVFAVCVLIFATSVANVAFAADENENPAESTEAAEVSATSSVSVGAGIGMLAAALVTGLSCLGAGIAVASSASAAIGAISENPKIFGQSLIFVALAEGVALYGLLISTQILAKL